MNTVTGLSLGRIALGAGAVAAPALAAKLFRLDVAANPQLTYMTRMFGSREIALGTLTLLAPTGARKKLIALGIGVDGADAFAGYDAWQSGAVDKQTGMFLAAPALGAVVAGVLGLAEKVPAKD